MNAELRRNKQVIRGFLQSAYSDERLAMLLAHAQSGKLSFTSCCCFIGVATADHPLRGQVSFTQMTDHLFRAAALPLGRDANDAYRLLGDSDQERIVRLIPSIRAEMKRRDRAALAASAESAGSQVNCEVIS